MTFKGANVFMSRNLVPPEMFDSLHDALKHNGAQIFLCCNPSKNGPNDYHIISSRDHEKFDDLRKKGCNLLGPRCVLSCAKEHRVLPKQGFTCCLALDGVKILASGFDMDEKDEIGKLVTAMGGVLQSKPSLDVSFVIVKTVLTAKYKWALNVLKKPIVSMSWLHQCWKEHRIVPQDSYRVVPFAGLTICVTKVPADERKEMEKLVIQNGGKYSAELTKKCTHLVCDAPEGDKFKVAKRWGHIYVVTRKWFDQSVARRACLNEESYPVQGSSTSNNTARASLKAQHNTQDKFVGHSLSSPFSLAIDDNLPAVKCGEMTDLDLEATLSQDMSARFPEPSPAFIKEDSGGEPTVQQLRRDISFDGCVADDSQTNDNDLYLCDCRILLVGFDGSEMRKLVNMVRRGGGSRYMSLNEKLTHIVVGTPSEIEKKELRALAAVGVIAVVRTIWLQDCDREKKEIPVLRRHIAYDLLVPKDLKSSTKRAVMRETVLKQGKSVLMDDPVRQNMNPGPSVSCEKSKAPEIIMKRDSSVVPTCRYTNESQTCGHNVSDKCYQKTQHGSGHEKVSTVFKEKLFQFSSSFPEERRGEIIEWITQGGGEVVSWQTEKNVHFLVECHGAVKSLTHVRGSTSVSSHWIRSCLEDGHLLDVDSHILYSPLPCWIPLPGFEKIRFCVSQYDEKERVLLRNLCFVLGAKFVEKLTRKVTHLLCKFTSGPKYEAACKWGILPVTSEWISECVKQNVVVAPGPFCPKEATSQDREAGVCTMSQYPTQAVRMVSGADGSEFLSQSEDPKNLQSEVTGSRIDGVKEEANHSYNNVHKRARLSDDESRNRKLSPLENKIDPICVINSNKAYSKEKTGEVSCPVPDVASAIEDLLEETSKIQDQMSPERIQLFSSDCSILGQDDADAQSVFRLSKHWINRTDKKEENGTPSVDKRAGIYDGFSETQTESQVVGYEEDLSGRQMIIDRVRTRSSMT